MEIEHLLNRVLEGENVESVIDDFLDNGRISLEEFKLFKSKKEKVDAILAKAAESKNQGQRKKFIDKAKELMKKFGLDGASIMSYISDFFDKQKGMPVTTLSTLSGFTR